MHRQDDEWSDNFDMTVVVALVLCAVLAGGQAKTHGKESVRIYIFAAEVPGGSPPGDSACKGGLPPFVSCATPCAAKLG